MYYNKLRLIYTKPLEDAEAYFAAAGITSTTEKDAYNAFVSGLKSDGVYSKLVTFHPFLGSNLTSKAYNAINPSTGLITFFSNMASVSGGVSISTDGYASFPLPSSSITANNAGFGAYSNGWKSIVYDTYCYIGYSIGGGWIYLKAYDGTSVSAQWDTIQGLALTSSKLISMQSTLISGEYATKIHFQGSEYKFSATANTRVPSGTFYFGNYSNSDDAVVTFGCHYTSLGLTSAEHALLNTRINTLMTAVGR